MKPFRLRYSNLPNGQGAPGVFLQGSSDYFFNPEQEKITGFIYKVSDNPELKELGGIKIAIKSVIDPRVSFTKSYTKDGKTETTKVENTKVKLFRSENE